jgi:hypothetical protein
MYNQTCAVSMLTGVVEGCHPLIFRNSKTIPISEFKIVPEHL